MQWKCILQISVRPAELGHPAQTEVGDSCFPLFVYFGGVADGIVHSLLTSCTVLHRCTFLYTFCVHS